MAKKITAKKPIRKPAKKPLKKRVFEYYINSDERGDFYADVRTKQGKTVFEIFGFEIFEDGFMKHKKDMKGLTKHLIDLGILNPIDEIAFVG